MYKKSNTVECTNCTNLRKNECTHKSNIRFQRHCVKIGKFFVYKEIPSIKNRNYKCKYYEDKLLLKFFKKLLKFLKTFV